MRYAITAKSLNAQNSYAVVLSATDDTTNRSDWVVRKLGTTDYPENNSSLFDAWASSYTDGCPVWWSKWIYLEDTYETEHEALSRLFEVYTNTERAERLLAQKHLNTADEWRDYAVQVYRGKLGKV